MRQLQGRQQIVKGIFLSVILILLIKLFYIQIIDSQYKKSAKNKDTSRVRNQKELQ